MDSSSKNKNEQHVPEIEKNILLIYSNKEISQQIRAILNHAGYSDITVADTAQIAISAMRETPFDCIIMDIDLSDIDGWRLSRLIRSNVLGTKPDIPIIIGSYTYSYRIAEATAKEFEVNAFVNLNDINNLPATLNDVLFSQQALEQSKLLLIEDTPQTIDLVKRFLDQRYDIEVATDGAVGLEAWKQGRHDLVLLDLMLPGKSGEEVLHEIMAIDPHQSVVMMTAHGNSEKAAELMLNGAADFISKPFRARQLRRVCEIAFHRDDYLISHAEMNHAISELNQSETRYRRLVESLSEEHFFYTQAVDGSFTYVGPTVENVLGYSVDDFATDYLTYLTDNSKNNDSIKFHKASLQGKLQPPFEIELRRHDGRICHLEITETPIFDNEGNVIAVDGIAHDITTRIDAQNQLKTLSNATFEGIVIHDHGTIIEINNMIEKMFNLERFELIGNDLYHLIATEYHEMLKEKLQQDTEMAIEAQGLRTNGDMFPINIHTRLLPFNGRNIQVVAIVDLTEQRRVEEEKEAIQKQLRQAQKMESIGHLTGGIAHDFNNILASIQGYTELALDMYEEEGKLNQYLNEVAKASERARVLIAQMLAFSRGGSVDPKPLELTPLINETIMMLRSTLPSSIELRENLPNDLPSVMVDAIQFHQIIMNMCINARDAISDENGIIEISLQKVETHDMTCSSCHKPINGGYMKITIRDNGTGMDSQTINSIFDPFYTTKPVDKGTGMGLSVVHGIIHDHNGHLHVTSEPGKGTEFALFFPVHHGDVESLQKPPSQKKQSGKGHIMVVDDDPELGGFLKEMLSSRGYNVELFNDPCEALGAFEINPNLFDLVLTDQTMPVLPGHKLAQALLHKRPDLPIILCTGYSEVMDEEKSKALNIKGYVQKPVESNKLVQLMNNLISPEPLELKEQFH